MDERILRYPELDIIFYEQFSQNQLEHVLNIIRVLAQYILLDTEMLMRAYKQRYKELMGLSYLKRAVREKLIIELSEKPDSDGDEVVYYYALKPSLHQYLNQNSLATNKLPFTAAHCEKSLILTFNRFCFQNRKFPAVGQIQDQKQRFFLCTDQIIYYHPHLIDADELTQWVADKELEDILGFVPIHEEQYTMGKSARVVYRKDLD